MSEPDRQPGETEPPPVAIERPAHDHRISWTALAGAIARPLARGSGPAIADGADDSRCGETGSGGDVGIAYARSTAATIDPWPEGVEFFRRLDKGASDTPDDRG